MGIQRLQTEFSEGDIVAAGGVPALTPRICLRNFVLWHTWHGLLLSYSVRSAGPGHEPGHRQHLIRFHPAVFEHALVDPHLDSEHAVRGAAVNRGVVNIGLQSDNGMDPKRVANTRGISAPPSRPDTRIRTPLAPFCWLLQRCFSKRR